jgi:hypothetical protein
MRKFNLEVIQDNDAENPRNWDNLGTMICFHNSYKLGDETDYRSKDYDSLDELKQDIEANEGEIYTLPLYLFDHSGVTMSTRPFGCSWDSGQVGFIYVSKNKVIKEYSEIIDAEKIKEYLNNEVKTYDQYLTGDVWGYVVNEIKICDEGHEHKENIESCWGFFGHEECENEGNSIIKYLENKN